MKRILVAALTVAMVLSQGVCTFAAETFDAVPAKSNGTVKVTYEKDTKTPPVYSVTVDWTDIAMEYKVTGDEIWDPETHTYSFDEDVEKEWVENVAEVSVTNHSNAGVTASIAEGENNKFDYTFNEDSYDLATAEETTVAEAPACTFEITAGDIPDDLEIDEYDEEFVVTINAEAEEPQELSLRLYRPIDEEEDEELGAISMQETYTYTRSDAKGGEESFLISCNDPSVKLEMDEAGRVSLSDNEDGTYTFITDTGSIGSEDTFYIRAMDGEDVIGGFSIKVIWPDN